YLWCLFGMYHLFYLSIFFFFSSRRRHTRCLSDWSSDVCSSDLPRPDGAAGVVPVPSWAPSPRWALPARRGCRRGLRAHSASLPRSEERRVGKECRSRRAQDHEKKKRKVKEDMI